MAKSLELNETTLEDRVNKPKHIIPLMENLRGSMKKDDDSFECDASVISYKTGIPQLDYYLGYRINVYDEDDNIVETYPSVGITGGSFVTFIGKPSTSKSTTAIQVAGNIVRQFENGSVVHFDLEQALNYTRIQNLTKFRMSEMKAGKYVLKQELNSITDIKRSIMKIYAEKTSKPELYKYNSGKRNEFGDEIIIFQPTVVIIDSIASLSTGFNENDKKDMARLEEVGSQTEKMRVTGEISRFFEELLPYIRKANIIIICINQIKSKPNLGFVSAPSDIMYLQQDESLPGGRAPQYYAHVLLKFIAVGAEKYNMEDDGFDGFGVRAMIIKSRGNQAGRSVNLVYDKVRGIDMLRSSVQFAKELGLTGGNKNSFYFNSNKDDKFSLRNIHTDFKENRGLYDVMFENIIPHLEDKLSLIDPGELEVIEEELNY